MYNAKKIARNSPYDFAFAVRGDWAFGIPLASRCTLQKTFFVLSHSGFFAPISFAQASLAQIWAQKNRMICIIRFSAVRGGFEPPEPLRVRQFSKLLVSATHPPHQSIKDCKGNTKRIKNKFILFCYVFSHFCVGLDVFDFVVIHYAEVA